MLEIRFICSCRTDFNDVQSKAVFSDIVIAGKVVNLSLTQPPLSADYDSYTAFVQVSSVIKQPAHQLSNYIIYRRQYISIDGFLKNNSADLQSLHLSQANASHNVSNIFASQYCFSYVNQSQDYILFINQSIPVANSKPIYRSAQVPALYTRTDKKLIKEVLCASCGKCFTNFCFNPYPKVVLDHTE